MAEELLKREKRIRLTALDVDPTMTHVARQRLDRFGTRAAVATGDATELPYDNQSHDYVLSWLMLHHTVEWERSLSEIHRVLKPGGMLIGYDLLDTGPARLFHRLDRSEHQLFGADHLQQTLAADFADEVQVDRKLGGLVCRFTARA